MTDNIKRRTRTDGFDEMINKDHRGARPDPHKVVAEYIRQYDGKNATELAREIIRWLNEGDIIE